MIIKPPSPQQLSEYYRGYLKYLPEEDMLLTLKTATDEMESMLEQIPVNKETFSYAPGKWMLKEVIGHLCDTERILTYRALCFARNDKTELPGFDENEYVANGNFKTRAMHSIGIEYLIVREASLALFNSLDAADFDKTGTANQTKYSVRHMLYFCIVHQRHHFNIIRERYYQ